MLDATRLRVLVAVARCGSVTAAAHALNYAQPSISHHIARLEAETGAKLMERAGRGVRLTEAGQLLADRAQEILGRLDAAEAELAAHIGLAHDRVRVATFGSVISTIVAAACAALHAERADIDIGVTQAEPDYALQLLRAGEVDLALTYRYLRDGTVPDSLLSACSAPDAELGDPQVVLDEQVYLVRRAGGPPAEAASEATTAASAGTAASPADTTAAASAKAVAAASAKAVAVGGGRAGDLTCADSDQKARAALLGACTGQRWITLSEHCEGLLADLCRCAGVAPEIAIRTTDSVAAQALIAAGLGVAIMPALALHTARHPGVEAISLPGVTRQTVALTYPASGDFPAVTRLREAIIRAAAALT